MTREDIIQMAQEARFYIKDDEDQNNRQDFDLTKHLEHDLTKCLERFAKLVAEHERNEIIEILDASTGYVQMDLIRERT